MRRKKEIFIGKEKVILSERSTEDIYNLADYSKKHFEAAENKNRFNTLIFCTAISESIRQTRKDFPLYRIIKKVQYRKYTTEYIFRNISLRQINDAEVVLNEIQGDKKKVETEKKLEEK